MRHFCTQASKYCKPHVVASSGAANFTHIPAHESWKLSATDKTAYVYYCANETVHGRSHRVAETPGCSKMRLIAVILSANVGLPLHNAMDAQVWSSPTLPLFLQVQCWWAMCLPTSSRDR